MKNSPSLRGAKSLILAAGIMTLAIQQGLGVDTYYARGLSIAAGGTLDISGTFPNLTAPNIAAATGIAVIIQATTQGAHDANVAAIHGWISSGEAGQLWTGTGITANIAALDASMGSNVLGVMMYDNQQVNLAKWGDITNLNTVPDANFYQVLMRTAYLGDFLPDGVLDFQDYSQLDYYFNNALIAQGDITGDGLCDSQDYSAIDYSFNNQVYGNLANLNFVSAGKPVGSAVVAPEPGSGILLAFGTVFLAGLRRSRQRAELMESR